MRNQLKIIKEQLDSLKWEAHNQGLDVPYEFYPTIDMAISNLQGSIRTLEDIISESEKKGKRQHKKRKRKCSKS